VRAERRERLQPEPREDGGLVVAEVFEQVTGMVGQAAAMGEDVGDRRVVGDPRVREREVGQVLAHRVRPGHLPALRRGGDHGRADRLRDRGQLEHGVGVDRGGLADLAHAEALGVQDLALVDDADRDSGDRGRREIGLDDPVERGDPRSTASWLMAPGAGDAAVWGAGCAGGGAAVHPASSAAAQPARSIRSSDGRPCALPV
jgi:hypothetical protein